MRSTLWVVLASIVCCGAVLAQQAPQGARGRGGRPAPSPRVVSFEARPSSIRPGESTVLVWQTENPAGLAIDNGIGPVTPRGSKQLKPAVTTTYTLTMRGPDNMPITSSVTVTVAGTTPVAASSTDQSAAKKTIARTADGKPDFSGVYAFGGGGGRGARGAAAAAPGGVARTPTLKPGAEKYKVNRGAQDVGRTADCMPQSDVRQTACRSAHPMRSVCRINFRSCRTKIT